MTRTGSLLFLLIALVHTLSGCGKELTPATQMIVTLRSELSTEISSIEASVYDVAGEKQGSHWEFDLRKHPLPFSFSVVPALKTTTDFMVVAIAKDADGKRIVESKAIARFVPRSTQGITLTLRASCVGTTCGPLETCVGLSAADVGCGAIPTLESDPVVAGHELDPSSTTETHPVGGADAAEASEGDASLSGLDASVLVDANEAIDATSVDPASDAAGAVNSSGACLASPGQPVCVDAVLHQCNDRGEVDKQVTCESPRQCQLGLASKACAACNPGVRRCTGVRLERCAEDGSKWELMKSCDSEALCNSVAGDCVSGACTAATRVCMNGGLFGCSQDLTQLTQLKPCSSALCDQTNGECDVCVPNAHTCNGNVAEVCDGRGQTLTRTECPGTTPKCTGAGLCVQCTAATDCPAPSNACQAATCTAGTARCGTTSRAAHTPCATGVCNGSGTCVTCVDDTDCKTTGAPKCSNARCVACLTNADCPATYECTTSQTCQKVSLAGTGSACVSIATPTNGMCGGYYCGVSSARFSLAFDPASACGPNAAFNCSGELERVTTKCATDNAGAADSAGAMRSCVQANPSVQSASIRTACIDCFVNEFQCCINSTACSAICNVAGIGKDCDDARKAAGCVSPLFTCTGLPNPL